MTALASDVTLRTRDGVRLAATYWDVGNQDIACVVAHGFTGSSRNPHVQRLCRGLVELGITVLAPDFRGHGRSGGFTTAGAEEIHDIAAGVAWLRDKGYRRVAVLGWSMGGSAVLRHAGLGGDADAVVSVSAPGTWFERGTRSMRIVHWMFEKRSGRVATRLLRRTRATSQGWDVVPEAPAEVAGAIHYFPLSHVEALAAAAPAAQVWIEPGMGHAEVATTPELLHRIGEWVRTVLEPEASVFGPSAVVCDDDMRDGRPAD